MIEVLFLFAAQLSGLPPPSAEGEIVVTARRLKDWRGKIRASSTGSTCKTTKSTGDRELDQIACDTLRYCTAQARAEFTAIQKLASAERRRQLDELNRRLATCGNEQQQLRVAYLMERRKARQDGDR